MGNGNRLAFDKGFDREAAANVLQELATEADEARPETCLQLVCPLRGAAMIRSLLLAPASDFIRFERVDIVQRYYSL